MITITIDGTEITCETLAEAKTIIGAHENPSKQRRLIQRSEYRKYVNDRIDEYLENNRNREQVKSAISTLIRVVVCGEHIYPERINNYDYDHKERWLVANVDQLLDVYGMTNAELYAMVDRLLPPRKEVKE